MKTLQNNFTTPEQSKRLLDLGVPKWTADCYCGAFPEGIRVKPSPFFVPSEPCWSGVRLMEIFDICFSIKKGEWPTTTDMTKTSGSVIEYLVTTFEIQPPCKLDFSKLEK